MVKLGGCCLRGRKVCLNQPPPQPHVCQTSLWITGRLLWCIALRQQASSSIARLFILHRSYYSQDLVHHPCLHWYSALNSESTVYTIILSKRSGDLCFTGLSSFVIETRVFIGACSQSQRSKKYSNGANSSGETSGDI